MQQPDRTLVPPHAAFPFRRSTRSSLARHSRPYLAPPVSSTLSPTLITRIHSRVLRTFVQTVLSANSDLTLTFSSYFAAASRLSSGGSSGKKPSPTP